MWSAGSERACAYWGRSRVGWRLSSAWSFRPVGEAGPAAALESLVAERAPRKKVALTVFLSGDLARPFVVPPVDGLADAGELHRVALSVCNARTGLAGPCHVTFDTRPDSGSAAWAVAVEEAVLEALRAFSRAKKWRLCSVQPAWADALAASGLFCGETRPGWFAGVDSDALTVLSLDGGPGVPLAATQAPPPSRESLGQMRRRALQANALEPDRALLFTLADASSVESAGEVAECPWHIAEGDDA